MSWHPECFNKKFDTNEKGYNAKYSSRCEAGFNCQFGGRINPGSKFVYSRTVKKDTFKNTSEMTGHVTVTTVPSDDSTTVSKMVRCIDTIAAESFLTAGASYEVVREIGQDYVLRNVAASWSKARFVEVTTAPLPKMVKCVDNQGVWSILAIGQLYEVTGESTSEDAYSLKSISGFWSKARFVSVDPIPTTNQTKSTADVAAEAKRVLDSILTKLNPIVDDMVTLKVKKTVDISKMSEDIAMVVLGKIASVTATRVEVKVMETGEIKDMGLQHKKFPILLKAIMARVNVWMAGPSASGKTTAAQNAAKALDLPFRYTGAVGDPYALVGYNDANGKYVRTPFREAWEHGGVFLWDEVDASDPNALLAFNAALANGTAPFPDGCIEKHKDCILIAAANTWGHGATNEYVGRLKMDAAFLKRFAFISWDYDDQLELATTPNKEWTKRVQSVRAKVKAKGLRVMVTPRESYMGAQLLAAGIPQHMVEEMTIKSGMTEEQWKQII